MRVTGATTSAAAVQSSKSLADAIAIAAVWFHGKRILFLIDDIWPTSTCSEGFLPDLECLLQAYPESHMAISTRSVKITGKRGSHVGFSARDLSAPSSLMMLLAHALPAALPSEHLLECCKQVLRLRAGLPISLSIAGAAIALRMSSEDEFGYECQAYAEDIQAQISLHPGASFLENAIQLSLAALVAEDREKTARGLRDVTEYSFSELYTSLCILESQQFAPVPVLARMWNRTPENVFALRPH